MRGDKQAFDFRAVDGANPLTVLTGAACVLMVPLAVEGHWAVFGTVGISVALTWLLLGLPALLSRTPDLRLHRRSTRWWLALRGRMTTPDVDGFRLGQKVEIRDDLRPPMTATGVIVSLGPRTVEVAWQEPGLHGLELLSVFRRDTLRRIGVTDLGDSLHIFKPTTRQAATTEYARTRPARSK